MAHGIYSAFKGLKKLEYTRFVIDLFARPHFNSIFGTT